uniref:(northern house mosquito) hypothetical protein n=1 Tax=Culex pipiens TaxID=7175 RepID=A0A8D8J1P6_CULPI
MFLRRVASTMRCWPPSSKRSCTCRTPRRQRKISAGRSSRTSFRSARRSWNAFGVSPSKVLARPVPCIGTPVRRRTAPGMAFITFAPNIDAVRRCFCEEVEGF